MHSEFVYYSGSCFCMIQIEVDVDGITEQFTQPPVPTAEYLTQAYPASDSNGNGENKLCNDIELPSGPFSYRLEELAFTRSGDKGNDCNIGETGFIIKHNINVLFILFIVNVKTMF